MRFVMTKWRGVVTAGRGVGLSGAKDVPVRVPRCAQDDKGGAKDPFTSANGTAPASRVKAPCSAISFAVATNPLPAARAEVPGPASIRAAPRANRVDVAHRPTLHAAGARPRKP